MTQKELLNLINKSKAYSEETQYIAELIKNLLLYQSNKYKKIDQQIKNLHKLEEQNNNLLNMMLVNYNPIFALSDEDMMD